MQQKLADTERRCAVLAAQTSGQGTASPAASDSFISRLLDIVADLYQQDQYRSEPPGRVICLWMRAYFWPSGVQVLGFHNPSGNIVS